MSKSSRSKQENDRSTAVNEELSDGSASAFEGTEMTDDTHSDEDLNRKDEKPVLPKKNNTERKDDDTHY